MNIPNSVIEDAKAAGFYTNDSSIFAEGRIASVYITEELVKFAELTLARNVPEVSNQNDLVMISRGDVEALKQEAIFGVFRRDAVEWDKLNAILSNAPVISGEAVAWLKFYSIDANNEDGREEGFDIAYENKEGYFPVYLSPQQTQEQGELTRKAVADALEEAAKICDDNLMSWADNEWNDAVKDCARQIRALIKRNAVKQVEVTA